MSASQDVKDCEARAAMIADVARFGEASRERGPHRPGAVSDPTGEQATRGGPYREWTEEWQALQKRLQNLAFRARRIAPRPVGLKCHGCGENVNPGQPTTVSGGYWHRRCYMRAWRANRR